MGFIVSSFLYIFKGPKAESSVPRGIKREVSNEVVSDRWLYKFYSRLLFTSGTRIYRQSASTRVWPGLGILYVIRPKSVYH